jgi:two-component system, OmpR family, sensor histidine kinase VanS
VREETVDRPPGLSVRLKLTLSYAGSVMLAGALLLGAVWVFLLRYVPRGETVIVHNTRVFISPGRGALLRDFAPAAAILGTLLLVFGLLGGWLLAGRMLARLEAHVSEQQRFAANASHELRTPLAITQTLLEVARNDQGRGNDELVNRLHFVNTRAIDLTEALLLLSRADQRSFTREHVDLSLIAEEATETLLPFAETRGVTIETSGDVTPRSAHPPSCCRWLRTSCTTRSSTTCLNRAPCGS